MKKALNFLGIFLSVILSVVLFVTLIASPLVNMVSTAFRPDTVKKIIEQIDFVELVLSNEELRAELANHGIDAEFLDEIKESKIVEEGVSAFIESLFEGKEFTKETVQNIVERGHEEAVYYIKGLSKRLGHELHELPDEEVKQIILDSVDESWDRLTESLPTPEDLGITQEEYDAMSLLGNILSGEELSAGQIIKIFYDGAVINLLLFVAAVLSVLILLLRFPKCKGFLWLFVVYLIAALLTFGEGAVINAIDVSVFPELEQLQDELLAPILSVMSGIIKAGAWTLLGSAVLWLAVYIAVKILKKVHKRTKALPLVTEEDDAAFEEEQQATEDDGAIEAPDAAEEQESIDDIIAATEELLSQTEIADEDDETVNAEM